MKNFRLQAIYQMALLLGFSSAFKNKKPLLLQLRQFQIIIIIFCAIFLYQEWNINSSASGQPGAEYWQNRADYVLTAKLNEAKMKID
jgi:hypothetical protein